MARLCTEKHWETKRTENKTDDDKNIHNCRPILLPIYVFVWYICWIKRSRTVQNSKQRVEMWVENLTIPRFRFHLLRAVLGSFLKIDEYKCDNTDFHDQNYHFTNTLKRQLIPILLSSFFLDFCWTMNELFTPPSFFFRFVKFLKFTKLISNEHKPYTSIFVLESTKTKYSQKTLFFFLVVELKWTKNKIKN